MEKENCNTVPTVWWRHTQQDTCASYYDVFLYSSKYIAYCLKEFLFCTIFDIEKNRSDIFEMVCVGEHGKKYLCSNLRISRASSLVYFLLRLHNSRDYKINTKENTKKHFQFKSVLFHCIANNNFWIASFPFRPFCSLTKKICARDDHDIANKFIINLES